MKTIESISVLFALLPLLVNANLNAHSPADKAGDNNGTACIKTVTIVYGLN
ncbi:hypothetical protein BHECKSOX_286 [Bathymodiolus heckerae thiotrophic gill symbiont]|nr:hypothetical protein [uncultured Gammaproteobacteria bacterium]SHN92184.1 hypothetical protein BHECKSOX_286 [Bathymodiolus heckerae thiotrophic gill symbiont]